MTHEPSAEQLHLRFSLPKKPAAVTLVGTRVTLRPFDLDADLGVLYAISNGDEIVREDQLLMPAYDADTLVWRYMKAGPFSSAEELGAWLQAQDRAPDGIPLTVIDNHTHLPIGVANFISNVPDDLKIELGSIWYSPLAQRTGANTEATYLMLRHAFGLGYRRLEWKCHSENQRSRNAALAMGFRFEGIQEAHGISKGKNRDTAWFRILDREWPEVEAMLKAKLAR